MVMGNYYKVSQNGEYFKIFRGKNVILEKGCYQQNVGTINYHRKAKIQNKRKQVIMKNKT